MLRTISEVHKAGGDIHKCITEYREKYQKGPWTGLEFRPLKPKEFVGLAAFDIGNLYLESRYCC